MPRQLLHQFPEARGKRVVIEIRSDYPLGDTEEKLVAAARQDWCDPVGVFLTVSSKFG